MLLRLPVCECTLDNAGVAALENADISPRSRGPVQALKTASRIDGVKRDSVRWESVRVASRIRFFWEKSDCVSIDESSDSDATSAGVKTFPLASTGSCGGVANGSTTDSELGLSRLLTSLSS